MQCRDIVIIQVILIHETKGQIIESLNKNVFAISG
jgi:hypothetical protein